MPKFITTIETSFQISEIIKNAQTEIILVSPYLKLSPNLKDALSDANRKGIVITLIYGKSDLEKDEQMFLDRLENLTIYFQKNLHGKCYFNETTMLITSMNLYESSEKKNKEFGILIDGQNDYGIYDEVIEEIRLLISSSQLKKKSKSFLQGFQSFVLSPLGIEELCNFLNSSYGTNKFTIQKEYYQGGNRSLRIVAQEFIPNVSIEIDRNIDFIFNLPKPTCEKIFNGSSLLTNPELIADYRVFWNQPYNVVKVYKSFAIKEKWNLLDNLIRSNYYKRAIDVVITEIKQDFNRMIQNP